MLAGRKPLEAKGFYTVLSVATLSFTRISHPLRIMGWIATAVMAFAAIGMLVTWNQS